MSLTNYAESAILNALFGKPSDFGALASAPPIYIGVATADPTDAGVFTNEPVIGTGGYARILANAASWAQSTAGSGNSIPNAVELAFPASSAAWSTGATPITHFFLCNHATNTTGMIASAALTIQTRTVNAAGVTLSFAASAITAALD